MLAPSDVGGCGRRRGGGQGVPAETAILARGGRWCHRGAQVQRRAPAHALRHGRRLGACAPALRPLQCMEAPHERTLQPHRTLSCRRRGRCRAPVRWLVRAVERMHPRLFWDVLGTQVLAGRRKWGATVGWRHWQRQWSSSSRQAQGPRLSASESRCLLPCARCHVSFLPVVGRVCTDVRAAPAELLAPALLSSLSPHARCRTQTTSSSARGSRACRCVTWLSTGKALALRRSANISSAHAAG